MNISNYLKRIKIEHELTPTKGDLAKLQYHHVTQIPFENLDIMRKTPLTLNTDKLYDKVVTRKRGGVCYELNGLYHSLLREIGFSVTMIAATVHMGDRWFIEGTHATNIVHLDGIDYLVDVGFGGNTPSQPIPLTGEEIPDGKYSFYRVRKSPDNETMFILEKKETEDWRKLYRFSLQARILEDFRDDLNMTQYSDQSVFNTKISVMIVTDKGRAMLHDQTLTQLEGLDKTKNEIESGQMDPVLKSIFNLEVK